MTTLHLTAAIEVAADAASVWSVVSDHRRDPEWRTGVLEMTSSTPGQIGVGTTTSEAIRAAGKVWHNDGEVLTVAPGTAFTWRTVTGAVAAGSRTVEPTGPASCRLTLVLNVTPTGFHRLMTPLLRRMLGRNLRRDVVALRDLVERGQLSRGDGGGSPTVASSSARSGHR